MQDPLGHDAFPAPEVGRLGVETQLLTDQPIQLLIEEASGTS